MLQRILPLALLSLLPLHTSEHNHQPQPSPNPIVDTNTIKLDGRSELNSPMQIHKLINDNQGEGTEQHPTDEGLKPVYKVVSTSQEEPPRASNTTEPNQGSHQQRLSYCKTLGYIGGSICIAGAPVIAIYLLITKT